MKKLFLLFATVLLVMAVPFASAQTPPWTGILASARAMNWGNAGVVGGIPSGTYTLCSTFWNGTSAPSSSLGSNGDYYENTAGPTMYEKTAGTWSATGNQPSTDADTQIAACSPGTYIHYVAGHLSFNSGLREQAPTYGVVLRGDGANQTFFAFTNSGDPCGGFYSDVCFTSGDVNYNNAPSNTANWTAGYTQGATTITLSAVTNLKVGNPIMLDQLDTGTSLSNDQLFICSANTLGGSTTPNCALQGQAGNGRAGRAETQVVTVTQCDGSSVTGHACASGTNITISPGLYMNNWASANSPGAWWATSPILAGGIEDVSVDNTNSTATYGVQFQNASNMWAKGVTGILADVGHFQINLAQHITVENSYMYRNTTSGSDSYGVINFAGSDILIQNNIAQGVPLPYNVTGPGMGTVVAYNFNVLNFYGSIGGPAGYLLGSYWDHTDGTELVLWEGNHGPTTEFDLVHGTHNLNTLFRNYFPGQGTCITGPASGGNLTTTPVWGTATVGTCLYNLDPIALAAYGGRIFNLVGNILGQTGVQAGYWDDVNHTATEPAIISTGFGNNSAGITVNNDPYIYPNLLLWGNCDAVNGFNNCRFVSSEVPSANTGDQAQWNNPVPGSHTLPASFYLTGTPSWWPSGKPFPPIGPDVTGGNESGVDGLAYTLPAEDCYFSIGGQTNGYNSTVLSFNESTCYASTGNVTLLPSTENFGSINVGSSSPPVTFTLTNNSGSSATGLTITGNTADFVFSSNTCGSTLAASASCSLVVTFMPAVSGPLSATLTVTYSGGDGASPRTSPLIGTGLISGTPAPPNPLIVRSGTRLSEGTALR